MNFLKNAFINILIGVGFLCYLYFINTTSDIYYRFSGGESMQLLLNGNNMDFHNLSMGVHIIGFIFVFFASYFLLKKMIKKGENKIYVISKEFILILISFYIMSYAVISTTETAKYNNGLIHGNTPLFSNNNTATDFLIAKNGIIFKQKNYYNLIANKNLNFIENQFLSMLDGTFKSYSNILKMADISDFTKEEKIWLYKLHFVSYKKLYTKLINQKGYIESSRNKIYTILFNEEKKKYKELTSKNYDMRKKECAITNRVTEISFCHKTNPPGKGSQIFVKDLKLLIKKKEEFKNKNINAESLASPLDIYNWFKQRTL